MKNSPFLVSQNMEMVEVVVVWTVVMDGVVGATLMEGGLNRTQYEVIGVNVEWRAMNSVRVEWGEVGVSFEGLI